MSIGTIVMVAGMGVIALIAIGFLIWGFSKGQFKNIEEAKYRMLEEKEPEPWPHQKENDHD